MKKYKAIIYDLDCTVLNTIDMNMYPLMRIIKEELNEDWTFEEVCKFLPYPGMKVMEELQIKDKETTYARWVKYVNEYEEGATLYEGFEKVLPELEKHMIQAVCSSKMYPQYKIDVIDKGLGGYFKETVLAEDTSKHKPDPEPLLMCLDKIGVKACEAIYIGDACSDYLAANNAGMDFGYATWGSASSEGIEHPTYIYNHPLDILKLIEE